MKKRKRREEKIELNIELIIFSSKIKGRNEYGQRKRNFFPFQICIHLSHENRYDSSN